MDTDSLLPTCQLKSDNKNNVPGRTTHGSVPHCQSAYPTPPGDLLPRSNLVKGPSLALIRETWGRPHSIIHSLVSKQERATESCVPLHATVHTPLHALCLFIGSRGMARRFSVRCDRHKGLTWEWMGARGLALRLRHTSASLPRPV
ncbi:unnamed protein product [Pleuronectes platessa]|uniref:Uncharacterized protein n=1 Tax=Pleuronectes platessa TaxID=8262 RepID=A0A9N7TWK8_PLEPL|nr:unnamed protein product [Pleuronectes platessa]